jgi:hypothetical protein|tara:strand:- start:521 stop:820 length:300 start_codon:yes stop_codon:yes gene_type:complete
MALDHNAIRKAYPQAVTIDDGTGAFDASGNKITIIQSNIDAARTTLNADAAKVKYKSNRTTAFASIGDQLDMQYWDAVNGTTTWKDHVAKVKSDNPKTT